MNFRTIDQKALATTLRFKKCEAELLEIIIQLDRFKVYRKLGYPSLFQYTVKRLKLSESQAYGFINVARKSHEIPKLSEAIKKGRLTINKARRITSVLTKTNQKQWLELAEKASQKKVEREVALANPQMAITEKMTYIAPNHSINEKVGIKRNSPRVQLQIGLSERTMLKLRRAQDLVSQKKKASKSLESTLETILDDYLKKHDPVEKAKRQKIKGKLNCSQKNEGIKTQPKKKKAAPQMGSQQSSRRVIENRKQRRRAALPAALKHQVYLKAEGRCSSKNFDGKRCQSRRFLEIHHIIPLSQGGSHQLENLTLLCSGHHKIQHDHSTIF